MFGCTGRFGILGSLAVTVRELLRSTCPGLVYLGQIPQQPKIAAELVMQRVRVIPHHLEAAALRRSLGPIEFKR